MGYDNTQVPTREAITEWLRDRDGDEILLADGFEEAFIGFVMRAGQPTAACYDAGQMRNVLMFRDGMTADEADEYLEFNVFGAYVGERTPVYLVRFADES